MSNTDFRSKPQSSSADLGDKLQQAGREARDGAADVLYSASGAARDKLDEIATLARETAEKAVDKIEDQVGSQQSAGADYAERLAENIRKAARAFETDTPFAARTIETAADYVEDAAGKFRSGSLGDVVEGMTSFARRQPAAFLGLSVLAGFAAVRFLKASSAGTSTGAPTSAGARRSS